MFTKREKLLTAQVFMFTAQNLGAKCPSVVRSRVKRIISEACRLNINKFANRNYVITAKEAAKDKSSLEIETELLYLLKKMNQTSTKPQTEDKNA